MKKYFLILFLIPAIFQACVQKQNNEADQKTDSLTVTVENKGPVDFDTYFLDKTLRLDYYHSGTATEEHFAVDKIFSDGPWGGSKNILIDEIELGLYFFEITDKETNTLLYSRGLQSIFGEWQTIGEAKRQWGTFHESIRFPWPKKPVQVIMRKRDTLNQLAAIWTTEIDPASRQVNPADIKHTHTVRTIMENGPAKEKVDIVILGDGYTQEEMDKFYHDAQRLSGILFTAEPFKSRKSDFNVRAVETPSQESGVTRPHPGIFKRTPLSVHYSSFDSERYGLTYDNRTVRDVASAVPYEFMIVLINEKTYGGGGIYKLYATLAVDNKYSDYIVIHEMGHHFAALADEYYTSSVSYEMGEVTVEPWETNITALLDEDNLKWKDLVEPGTPLPTPYDKEAFDQMGYAIQKERDSLRTAKVPEAEVEALFDRQLLAEEGLFSKEPYKDMVGAFEGACYMPKGLYRSSLNCIMLTRKKEFCKVCQQSINDVIDQYTK